jgi:hypothetical protein
MHEDDRRGNEINLSSTNDGLDLSRDLFLFLFHLVGQGIWDEQLGISTDNNG